MSTKLRSRKGAGNPVSAETSFSETETVDIPKFFLDDEKKSDEDVDLDVIVVGGGVSGLCTSYFLLSVHSSLRIAVLEASPRVGGRTLTEEHCGVQVDLGGTWIGSTQYYVKKLIEVFGIQTAPQYHEGVKISEVNGRILRHASTTPHLSFLSLLDFQINLWRLDRLRKKVNVRSPQKTKDASYYDSMSVQTWMEQNIWTSDVRQLFEVCVRGVFGCEASELSFLQFLHYVQCSGGVDSLISIPDGHQESVIVGGAQQISTTIASTMGPKGFQSARVVLNHEVTGVDQHLSYLKIHYINHRTKTHDYLTCKYLVFACPPVLQKKISFNPRLPPHREMLMQKSFMGSIIKIVVFYKTTFWRQYGYSGEVVCDCLDIERSPVFNVYDFSRKRSDGLEQPALVCFINGDAARYWSIQDKQTRKHAVLSQIHKWFCVDEALNPLDYVEKDWVNDEWTRGCPVNNLPSGTLYLNGQALRTPIGRIHFAGTETAVAHQGFIDGAVSAAQRAAEEVANRVSQDQQRHPVELSYFDPPRRSHRYSPFLFADAMGVVFTCLIFILPLLVYYFYHIKKKSS